MSTPAGTERSPFDLADKNAIVTGGAMSIGFGICKRLAEAGANVLIADLYPAAAEARRFARQSCRHASGRHR